MRIRCRKIGSWRREQNRMDQSKLRTRCKRRLLLENLELRALLAAENPLSLGNLDGMNGFRIDGVDIEDFSGVSVRGAGDVNGDGLDDVIIGASLADPNGNSTAGQTYVVFGRTEGGSAALDLASLDGANGFRIDGIDPGDNSGRAVSGAGDVNGDGLDDLVIGAEGADPDGRVIAGESYVVFGQSDSFPAAFQLISLDGTNGFRIEGVDGEDISGRSVSGAGDVNGDGFDDIIIGADGAADNAGETYVVFGKADGFDAALTLASLDGDNGFRVGGIDPGDSSGYSASGAGDLNGDGFGDLIIGARNASSSDSDFAGETYVVFGKPGDFAPALALSGLDGGNGFRIDGAAARDYSGVSVSHAGDVNGDGLDDLIVGAEGTSDSAGASYVIYGQADGFPAALSLSTLDAADGFRIDGVDAGDLSGRVVSGAGDVNGDGLDDLIIGAQRAAPGDRSDAGESYVVFGSSLSATGPIDLANLDGNNGFRIDGIQSEDRSGSSVSGAGDLNGDGFDDLIIGALEADPQGKDRAGQSYVVFGGDFTTSVTQLGDATDNTLVGDVGANVIIGGRGDDELAGSGGADVLRGGQGNDQLVVTDLTFARLAGGNGVDTLRFDAADATLDLTAISDQRIVDIEAIDLQGSGPQTLALNVGEVLRLSSHSNTVSVLRDSDDQVQIGDGWENMGNETIDGETFTIYSQGAATLRVQGDSGHTNPVDARDVDGDGFVVPRDALIIINRLNSDGSSPLTEPNADGVFVDVNADGWITPVDALLIINHLNRSAGEGENSHERGNSMTSGLALDSESDDDEFESILSGLARTLATR